MKSLVLKDSPQTTEKKSESTKETSVSNKTFSFRQADTNVAVVTLGAIKDNINLMTGVS